jgi:hypothetical protein
MMDGRLVGGWEYVWAAYGITWAALFLYAAFSVWRERRSRTPPPVEPRRAP